jgi:hypothetical protein
LENTPMESNYRKYSFCFLFSTPKIMTSVFPLLRYWNPKRVIWMESAFLFWAIQPIKV